MSTLICVSCNQTTGHLIGKECEKCRYKNQPLDQRLRCENCNQILGYYREEDFDREPNYINAITCPKCIAADALQSQPKVKGENN